VGLMSNNTCLLGNFSSGTITAHRLSPWRHLDAKNGQSFFARQGRVRKERLLSIPTRLSAMICLGVLIGGPSPARGQGQDSGQAPARSASIASAPTAEEYDADKQNMLVIYKALKAYEKEHGKLPDWLSDLVPKYIEDSSVLVSPFFRRTGKQELYGNEDPRVTTSYIYEFSAKPVPKVIHDAFPNLAAGITMREWKTKQIAEFGSVVPILRCFLHNPVLNVTSDGEFFESGAYWETDQKTLELRKKRLTTGSKAESKPKDP
jgi:hypothetical protein